MLPIRLPRPDIARIVNTLLVTCCAYVTLLYNLYVFPIRSHYGRVNPLDIGTGSLEEIGEVIRPVG